MTNKFAAIEIVKVLRQNGFIALLAGGCVRDMLLRKRPKDYDVATDAKPEKIIILFKRTLKVGAKFGVVIVMLDRCKVEVATFRSEADYTDGRHPQQVHFTNPEGDASRRDFTINGLFYDPVERKVIDFIAGRMDLKKKLIRTIGEPDLRFNEDYLRMLRAIRFSAQLGFKIDPKTFDSIRKNAHHITSISGERIFMELNGILSGNNPAIGIELLHTSNLAQSIFPDFEDEKINYAVKLLENLTGKISYPLGLAALFAGCTTELALKKIACLKLSTIQTKQVKFLLENRDRLLDSEIPLWQLKMLLASPFFTSLLNFQKAILKTGHNSLSPITTVKKLINKIPKKQIKPRPLLNGNELMKLGALEGPMLGKLTKHLYIAQLDMIITSKQEAKKFAQQWLVEHSKSLE